MIMVKMLPGAFIPVLFYSNRSFSGTCCPASLAAKCDRVTRFDEWPMSRNNILPYCALTMSMASRFCCAFYDTGDNQVVVGAGIAVSS